MRRAAAAVGVVVVVLVLGAGGARGDLAADIARACHAELATFCKGVPFGGWRVLACLYANQDRVSGRCEAEVLRAASKLEEAAAALQRAAEQCHDELERYCGKVAGGAGRLKKCLEENEAALSGACRAALQQAALGR